MSDDKKPKTRSPNYPAITLGKAIARAKEIFAKFQRHATSPSVIAKCWELSEKSGGFIVQLAALRAFSLLENVPNNKDKLVKLTEVALDIVNDYSENSAGWKSAVQRAALAPGVHSIIREKYGPALPADDEVRRFLVRELKFSDRAVSDFISEFKETMTFAKLLENDKVSPADEQKDQNSWSVPSWGDAAMKQKDSVADLTPLAKQTPPTGHRMRDLPVTLPSSLEVAIFRVPVPMSETDYKTLVSSLASMKDTLVAPDKK